MSALNFLLPPPPYSPESAPEDGQRLDPNTSASYQQPPGDVSSGELQPVVDGIVEANSDPSPPQQSTRSIMKTMV
jgi:hypothetical protein